ncbi:DUF1152 domain-containing protein [Streptomyces sp. NPDC087917]|uniref:DUF1152 domain-containing protein n=1 Tax=Streptomyces sp. NPDC087917 TaxID=3155060 RepID=UPI003439CEAB
MTEPDRDPFPDPLPDLFPDLFIAAGGGGDPVGTAVTASAVARAARRGAAGAGVVAGGVPARRHLIATYAWERLEVDPTPGPLGAADFTEDPARPAADGSAGALVLTPATRAVPPAGSTLPRLAADLPARLLLLDPCRGLAAMAEQVRRMVDAAGARHVRLVDMGGDVLAHGDEKTLCSPLVDALAVAACVLAGVDASVYVAGPGTDGEIPQEVLLERLEGAERLTPDAYDADTAASALAWHPSEASALFAAAVYGVRGAVRTVERLIPLTDASAHVHRVDLDGALAHSAVARRLLDVRPDTLEEAADLSARLTGIHELERERTGAARRPSAAPPGPGGLPDSGARAVAAVRALAPGATHATYRFAAGALGLGWRDIPSLRALVGGEGPLLPLS